MSSPTVERATNRLASELSPYLRQHAHNPVDWYPWGDEALRKARTEDRPILLSVGYSACHWCHVMERESFDDPRIAEVMNERFVSIKVDREERPDLDQIYQLTVQLMGRGGGWPLTVFLTPKLEPFFAGTYFPPVDRHGMPGFPTVLRAVADAYRDRRDEVERSAAELTRAIERVATVGASPADPPADVLEATARELAQHFDETHGGFGSAPKFPNTLNLDVLLRAWKRHGDADSLERVCKTLDVMRDGGLYDQLGGGFHRYCVDERWAVPHFEKMLYDNALLARLYVDGWRATGNPRYAETARETLEYVLREMRSAEGGFYSSQDADSEGEEGKFFVWSPEQIEQVLGEQDARLACRHWGVTEHGNFDKNTTVLHVARTVEDVAAETGRPEQEVRAALRRSKDRLFEAREQRVKPFRDEKVIATWNGLMTGAFADVGAALDEPRYLDAARAALAFVRERLWQQDRLLRIYKDGQARVGAFLEDYADMAAAALDVHEATLDDDALRFAEVLARTAIERFWDEDRGGFFFAGGDDPELLVRPKDSVDTSVPSGTSSICHVLLRLHALTDDAELFDRAERTIRGLSRIAVENPLGFGHMLGAISRYVHGPTELTVVGARDAPATRSLLQAAHRQYVPDRVVAVVAPDAPTDARGPAARLQGQRQRDGQPTAYVCRARACSAPVTDPSDLEALLS